MYILCIVAQLNITQLRAAAPWGRVICEHNVLFMLGLPYTMNST
jgi:hypothetical protein